MISRLLSRISPANRAEQLLCQCVRKAERDSSPINPAEFPSSVRDQLSLAIAEHDPQADIQLQLSCPRMRSPLVITIRHRRIPLGRIEHLVSTIDGRDPPVGNGLWVDRITDLVAQSMASPIVRRHGEAMTDYLAQLSSRGLDAATPIIRPRALSRYEADPGTQELSETDSFTNEAARPQPTQSIDAPRQAPNVAAPLAERIVRQAEPKQSEHVDDYSNRIAQLNQRIDALTMGYSGGETSATHVTQSFSSPITNVETHLHQQIDSTHINPTQVIENTNRETVLQRDAQQIIERTNILPNVSVEPNQHLTGDGQNETGQQSAIAQVESPPSSPVPQIVVQRLIDRPSAVPVRERNQAPAPPPQIVVEKQPEPPQSHTVTVKIGRIEVRSPKKESAPAPKSRSQDPRIMTLDDYIRQRGGGA